MGTPWVFLSGDCRQSQDILISILMSSLMLIFIVGLSADVEQNPSKWEAVPQCSPWSKQQLGLPRGCSQTSRLGPEPLSSGFAVEHEFSEVNLHHRVTSE